MRLFLFLFITIPIVELYILIAVGKRIGAVETIALVLATAVLGLALLKRQGYKAMLDAQTKMAQGTLPAKELVDGVFLAVGGALLLTPGFVTDALGFCCLMPGLRHGLVYWLVKRLRPVNVPSQTKSSTGRTIEGQFDRED